MPIHLFRLTAMKLAIVLLVVESAVAYSTDGSPFAPSIPTFTRHQKTSSSSWVPADRTISDQSFAPKSRKYDLGLPNEQNAAAAAKHWQPYESTRAYPNPAFVVERSQAKQQRQIPVIQPRRHNRDLFEISNAPRENHDAPPTMIAKEPLHRFELNTPWIEFLLHEQEVKHSLAQT